MYDIVTFDIIGYKTKRLVDLERNIIEILSSISKVTSQVSVFFDLYNTVMLHRSI